MTTEEVLAGCPGGPAAGAYAARLRQAVHPRDGDPGSALGVWLTDLLLIQTPDYADGVWLLATAWGTDPETWMPPAAAAAAASGDPPAPCASLTGARFFSLSTAPVFDLAEGTRLPDALPADWLETRVFNLSTLYALCRGKAREWTARQKPGPTPTPSP